MPPFRIGVISDTHGRLDPMAVELLKDVDLILHAGDVGGDAILDELERLAPVLAVSGNVDGSPTPRRPDRREIETPLGRVAMTHGHLPDAPSTDRARLLHSFAAFQPRIVIYGHSHSPKLETIEGVSVFNPGAAGPARFRQKPTIGIISGGKGGPVFEHKPLDHIKRGLIK